MKQELVKDWMTRKVVTTSPTTPLTLARELMKHHDIRRLPVLDEGNLVGIITFWDIHEVEPVEISSASMWELHSVLSRLYVSGDMTPGPVTISPEDTIGHAANVMLENKVSGLPVVGANQQLVGIITESDIFRLVIKEWGK